MVILKIAGLGLVIDGKTLLKNINLEVNRGEIFVIIGPTGAGKTTLLRLIDLLDRPGSGEIYFNGLNITGTAGNIMDHRRHMSMVFQKPVVFTGTVFENIAYPLNVRGMDRKSISRRVDQLLTMTGLAGYGKRKAKTLSGGEMQRVALARAMAAKPEVLLLDEPTANLDPLSVRLIEKLIIDFNRDSGATIVMATHDMLQGQRLAHRVGVMMHGELVQVGRPQEIFYQPEDIRVAGFVGIENILRGRITSSRGGIADMSINGWNIQAVTDLKASDEVDVYIKPDDIVLSADSRQGSARNTLSGKISSIQFRGALCTVQMDCGFPLIALITGRSAEEMGLQEGKQIFASFKATAVRVLPVKQAQV